MNCPKCAKEMVPYLIRGKTEHCQCPDCKITKPQPAAGTPQPPAKGGK